MHTHTQAWTEDAPVLLHSFVNTTYGGRKLSSLREWFVSLPVVMVTDLKWLLEHKVCKIICKYALKLMLKSLSLFKGKKYRWSFNDGTEKTTQGSRSKGRIRTTCYNNVTVSACWLRFTVLFLRTYNDRLINNIMDLKSTQCEQRVVLGWTWIMYNKMSSFFFVSSHLNDVSPEWF